MRRVYCGCHSGIEPLDNPRKALVLGKMIPMNLSCLQWLVSEINLFRDGWNGGRDWERKGEQATPLLPTQHN